MKTPNSIPLFHWSKPGSGALNAIRVWLLLPTIRYEEDLNYGSSERGAVRVELDAPNQFHWARQNHFWTVTVRFCGVGLTISKQKGGK